MSQAIVKSFRELIIVLKLILIMSQAQLKPFCDWFNVVKNDHVDSSTSEIIFRLHPCIIKESSSTDNLGVYIQSSYLLYEKGQKWNISYLYLQIISTTEQNTIYMHF